MSKKNNTRSIKKIEETMLQRLDTRRKLERIMGRPQDEVTQGTGWAFIPAPR